MLVAFSTALSSSFSLVILERAGKLPGPLVFIEIAVIRVGAAA